MTIPVKLYNPADNSFTVVGEARYDDDEYLKVRLFDERLEHYKPFSLSVSYSKSGTAVEAVVVGEAARFGG
jgi:hypothetical protein